MPESSPDFNPAPLREALLNFLWRQWSALGVAGASRSADDWVIDPEALLLASTTLARHDPRLFDEIIDWLTQYGDRINLQRLRRLLATGTLGDATILAAIATRLARTAALRKWAALASAPPSTPESAAPRPLFLRAESIEPLPSFGRKDPDFLAYGWARPPVETRGLSVAPSPHATPALLLRLRSLFGVQARAEIVAILLGREAATPAELARLAAYTPRTAEDTLRDLAAGDFIIRHRQGRAVTCRIRPEAWKLLLLDDTGAYPRWVDWTGVFAALTRILAVLDRPVTHPLLHASELRQAAGEHTAALLSLGITAGEHDHGTAFAEKLLANLRRALGEPSA